MTGCYIKVFTETNRKDLLFYVYNRSMPKEILLDRRTFEALAIDTRVDILKSLKQRNKTASELSKELELAVSTVSEHLDKMKEAGLIERKQDHHKWVYYKLTEKGLNIVAPRNTSVFVFALSISLFMIVMGFYWFNYTGNIAYSSNYLVSGGSALGGQGKDLSGTPMYTTAEIGAGGAPAAQPNYTNQTTPASIAVPTTYGEVLPWLYDFSLVFIILGAALFFGVLYWRAKK